MQLPTNITKGKKMKRTENSPMLQDRMTEANRILSKILNPSLRKTRLSDEELKTVYAVYWACQDQLGATTDPNARGALISNLLEMVQGLLFQLHRTISSGNKYSQTSASGGSVELNGQQCYGEMQRLAQEGINLLNDPSYQQQAPQQFGRENVTGFDNDYRTSFNKFLKISKTKLTKHTSTTPLKGTKPLYSTLFPKSNPSDVIASDIRSELEKIKFLTGKYAPVSSGKIYTGTEQSLFMAQKRSLDHLVGKLKTTKLTDKFSYPDKQDHAQLNIAMAEFIKSFWLYLVSEEFELRELLDLLNSTVERLEEARNIYESCKSPIPTVEECKALNQTKLEIVRYHHEIFRIAMSTIKDYPDTLTEDSLSTILEHYEFARDAVEKSQPQTLWNEAERTGRKLDLQELKQEYDKHVLSFTTRPRF